ncbi:MAG: AmmeMemoRadiSam system radical SAM enzyme, partial [Methanobacteriaceae archaeon]
EDLKALVKFMAEEVGVEVPLHFSRFFPYYQLKDVHPTPVETLENAQKIAYEAGMKYVYVGNVPSSDGENTYCPECQKLLIKRDGFQIVDNKLKEESKCPKCGAGVDLIL